jgi:ADP-heptose:LPS heptosyltransferase
LIAALKQTAYGVIAAVDRSVRTLAGRAPSLDPSDLRAIHNFLIPVVHPFLGAAVHETPLLAALRSAIPDANIVAVGSGIGAEVYRNNPNVTRIVPAPNPHKDFGGALSVYREVVRSFQGEPWCALFTGWNGRLRVLLATMLSANGVRAGFSVAPAMVHLPLTYDRARSQIANNLRLPGLVGRKVVSLDLEPRVYFTESDLRHACGLLSDVATGPVAVLITCTSGGQPTRWPDDRFVSVARHLVERHGCRIVLPGTAHDGAALAQLVLRIGGRAKSLAGLTSISQLAAVCALSDVAVAVDTGATHVARSQELPLIVVAPAYQDSVEWMPVGKPWARILKGPRFPSPPPVGYALEEIAVDQVNTAADELLQLFPPLKGSREDRVRRSLVV